MVTAWISLTRNRFKHHKILLWRRDRASLTVPCYGAGVDVLSQGPCSPQAVLTGRTASSAALLLLFWNASQITLRSRNQSRHTYSMQLLIRSLTQTHSFSAQG